MKKELEILNQEIAKVVSAFENKNEVELFTIHVEHEFRGTKKYSLRVECSVISKRAFKK